MKKVILGIMIFLIGVLIGASLSYLFYQNKIKEEKEKTKNIVNEILELIEENVNLDELKEKYQEEFNKIKENAKDKLEEQEIWQKAKEKLEQALLS